MHSRIRRSIPVSAALLMLANVLPSLAAQDAGPDAGDWVARSDANSAVLMEVFAKFSPGKSRR